MRYLLIGGNPFRMYNGTETFTSLRVVGGCNTEDEAREMFHTNYESCGGLLLIVDTELGREATV